MPAGLRARASRLGGFTRPQIWVEGLRISLAIDLKLQLQLQVEVYMMISTLNLKMKIDSDETFETIFLIHMKQV
jgi:hypothetical protein